MADRPNIGRHRIDIVRIQVAISSRRHGHVMQDGVLEFLDAAVAPDEHADRQVVAVGRSLAVDAVTDAALAVRRFAMKHAIAMKNVFTTSVPVSPKNLPTTNSHRRTGRDNTV